MQARNLTTIAIPAIGTGNLSFPRDRVANISLDEVAAFSQNNPTSGIKEVRFVVYDKDQTTVQAFQAAFQRRRPQGQSAERKRHVFREYHEVVTEDPVSKSHGPGGLLSEVSNYIGGWLGSELETISWATSSVKPGYPIRDLLRFTVYAGNKKDLKDAEKAIEDLVVENYKYKEIEHDAVAKLSSNEKTQILQLQDKHETRIEIEDEVGRIVVRGHPDDVLSAATEIFAMLNKTVERENNRGIATLFKDKVATNLESGEKGTFARKKVEKGKVNSQRYTWKKYNGNL